MTTNFFTKKNFKKSSSLVKKLLIKGMLGLILLFLFSAIVYMGSFIPRSTLLCAAAIVIVSFIAFVFIVGSIMIAIGTYVGIDCNESDDYMKK